MLVFLAPDKARLEDLDQAVRQYLAWDSIEAEAEGLNLDAFQQKQAKTKRKESDEAVDARMPEAFQWLLVPSQPDPKGPVEWQEVRLSGHDPLAVRASKKLKNEEQLLTMIAPTRLKLELDRVPLWRGDGNHVGVAQLWEDLCQYLYLPRLRNSDVLLDSVKDGIVRLTWRDDTFGYADAWDDERKRYRGLAAGTSVSVSLGGDAVLVRPDVADKQLDAEASTAEKASPAAVTTPGGASVAADAPAPPADAPPVTRRFHGSVTLDPDRLIRRFGDVAQEVIQHLSTTPGAKVSVTVEVQAELPEGAPDHVVRTVNENCRDPEVRELRVRGGLASGAGEDGQDQEPRHGPSSSRRHGTQGKSSQEAAPLL